MCMRSSPREEKKLDASDVLVESMVPNPQGFNNRLGLSSTFCYCERPGRQRPKGFNLGIIDTPTGIVCMQCIHALFHILHSQIFYNRFTRTVAANPLSRLKNAVFCDVSNNLDLYRSDAVITMASSIKFKMFDSVVIYHSHIGRH